MCSRPIFIGIHAQSEKMETCATSMKRALVACQWGSLVSTHDTRQTTGFADPPRSAGLTEVGRFSEDLHFFFGNDVFLDVFCSMCRI